MPRENTAQTSWKYGEISPLLRGRIDTEAWKNGAETLENFVVTPQGGLLRRPGVQFIETNSGSVKLIPFVASNGDYYVLQMDTSVAYMEVFKDGVKQRGPVGRYIENIVDNGSGACRLTITNHNYPSTSSVVWGVTGSTGANGVYTANVINSNTIDLTGSVFSGTYTGGGIFFGAPTTGTTYKITNVTYSSGTVEVTTSAAHGFVQGDSVGIAGVEGFTGVNGTWTVTSAPATTKFQFSYSGTVATYTANGATAKSIMRIKNSTLSGVVDISRAQYAQSADVMFVVSENFAPLTIEYGGYGVWEVAAYVPSDGPYLNKNNTYIRLGVSGVTDSATFEDTQIGSPVSITGIANAAGLFRITSVAHGLSTNDRIRISGVSNYAAANGYWVITKITNDTFDLNGSAFAGAGAVDGTWKQVVYFVVGDVGKYLQFREDNLWKLAKVTAYTSETKVTCDILGNLMLDIDPTITLSRKATLSTTDQVSRTDENSNYTQGQYRSPRQGYTPEQRRYYNARPKTKKSTVGYDPATGISFAASTLTSDHTGTFSKHDVGKFIKTSVSPAWYLISAVTNLASGRTATAAAATRIAGANETTERGIVYYNRSITGTVTSSAPNALDPSLFNSSDVGRPIRLNFTGVSAWCRITAYASATQVSVKFFQDLPLDPQDSTRISNDGITADWQLGAFGSVAGWPRTVAIHEQRLCFGGTASSPQTVWMSISGDYWNFAPTEPDGTVLDDSGITYTVASDKVNRITWLNSARVLLIGTGYGEWAARAATSTMEPITPTNLSVVQQSAFGSVDNHQARRIGNSVYFLQRGGERLRKMTYDVNIEGFKSDDVSIASEHMMKEGRSGVVMDAQITPFQVLWIVLDDGSLASVTLNENENQYSWSHHSLGDGGTTASDVCVVQEGSSLSDSVYCVISNGNSFVSSIGRMGQFWSPRATTAISALTAVFLDGYYTTTITAASSVSVSSYFSNGDVVGVMMNGVYLGEKTVSGGSVALGATYTGTVAIGFNYTSRLKMLPPEGGSAFGTALAKTKRVHRVGVRHFNSYKFSHGPDTTNLISYTIPGTTTNFFTGDDKFQLNSPYGLESGYVIQVDEPWPIGILAVAPELKTNE